MLTSTRKLKFDSNNESQLLSYQGKEGKFSIKLRPDRMAYLLLFEHEILVQGRNALALVNVANRLLLEDTIKEGMNDEFGR